MNTYQLLYLSCIVSAGLVAGLFYGYQCSVINGLGALSDAAYLAAFKSINKAILNPVFFLSFLGSLVLLIVATYLSYTMAWRPAFSYFMAATIIYSICVFGVTVVCNVPLNTALDTFNAEAATGSQLKEMRLHFESAWNRWHLVRTIASVVSFIILCIPAVKRLF